MATSSSHIAADAHNQMILQLHREWNRRAPVADPEDYETMDQLKDLAEGILDHDANTPTAVCCQLRVIWETFGDADTFDLEAFAGAFQRVCEGAIRVVASGSAAA